MLAPVLFFASCQSEPDPEPENKPDTTAQVTITPSATEIDFGTPNVGTAIEKTLKVTVANFSGELAYEVIGENSAEFSVKSMTNPTPGNYTLRIVFKSIKEGTFSAALKLTAGSAATEVALKAGAKLKALPKVRTTDATFKDLKDNQYSLKDMLAAGKAVFFDFSAVWCGPCYQLHKTGHVEDLWKKYGPNGSGEMEVFWVEADGAGMNPILGKGGGSQGDWTLGGTVEMPMVSDGELQDKLGTSNGYIPFCCVVFPDGTYLVVTEQAWKSAAAIYEAALPYMQK